MPMPPAALRLDDLGPMLEEEEQAAPPTPRSVEQKEPSSPFPLTPRAATPTPTPRARAAPQRFDDLSDPDPSEQAPSAPLTPWQDVPPLVAVPGVSSPPVAIDDEDDADDLGGDTTVGEVPKTLLDMTSVDENTRAYTAPRELIELARRKREERMLNRQRAAQQASPTAVTERPPRRGPDTPVVEAFAEESVPRVSTGTFDDGLAELGVPTPVRSSRTGDAGSAVSAADAPRASAPRGFEAQASAGERRSAPAIAVGGLDGTASVANVAPGVPTGRGMQRWYVLAALCIIVGFVASRWRAIEHLFFR